MNENNANFTPAAPNFKTLVRMCFQGLTNFPYIEEDFDALTNYELLSKVVEYLNQVISNNNEQNTLMTGLYNAYVSLQNYVNNYFENLDVQDEINNKLDEMAEAGTLQEIIANYLNSKALFGFDNVASMKQATNLINGSYAKTLGFYNKNDGGNALYKIRNITNDDVVDEMTIISLSDENLIAELIVDNIIDPLTLGAKGDGTTDDSTPIQKAINLGNVKFSKKTYKINSSLIVNSSNKTIDLNNSTILCNDNPCFKINSKNAINPLTWIKIMNGKIESNGNGIECYDSYFIKLNDISIKLKNSNTIGILFENGFNNDFIKCHVYGIVENENCIGIKYAINNQATITGITNITNIKIEDCLIQRLSKGIQIYGQSGGSYDSCCMINNGFSYCSNVAIDMDYENVGNWNISTTRCETSSLFLVNSNSSYINITDLYLYNTNGINNKSTTIFNGTISINKNDNTIRYLVTGNSGEIKFNNTITKLLNSNELCDSTVLLTKITSNSKYFVPVNTNITKFLPAYINIKYTGTQSASVNNISAPEGAEMYLLRRTDDYGWLLPDGSTYTAVGTLYHLLHINNEWKVI